MPHPLHFFTLGGIHFFMSYKLGRNLPQAAKKLKRGDGIIIGDKDFKALFRKKWKYNMKV